MLARGSWAAGPVISGPNEFALADCNNASIILRFTSDTTPLALRTNNPKPDSGTTPVVWTIEWEKPALSQTDIQEYRSIGSLRGGCPAAGSYTVPITVSLNGTPPTAASLDLRLRRIVDPALDAPSAITFPISFWPWESWFDTGEKPISALTVRESSNSAKLPRLTASAGPLKNAAGETTGIQLVPPAAPLDLAAGDAGAVALALSEMPGPGTYTTQLVLHAPPLPDKTVDVTLKLRIFSFVLLVVLIAGVVLGWVVNTELAARAARDAARLSVLRVVASLRERAGAQKDPTVQQRLLEVAENLESKLVTINTADDAKALVDPGLTLATGIETQSQTDETRFTTDLVAALGVFAPSGAALDDMVATPLTQLTDQLDLIAAAGSAGDITQASLRLKEFQHDCNEQTIAALGPWLVSLLADLDKLGTWPDPAREPEATRTSLRTKVLTAMPVGDAATAIRQSNALALELRVWAIGLAPGAIAAILRAAADLIRRDVPNDAAELDAIATIAGRAGAATDPIAVLRTLQAERRRAEALFLRIATNRVGLDAALRRGDFSQAAGIVVQPSGAMALVAAAGVASPVITREVTQVVAPQPVVPPRLLLPTRLSIDTRTTLHMQWGSTQRPAAAIWRCDPPNSATITNDSPDGADVTARTVGPLTITVAAQGSGASFSSRTYAGDQLASPDFARITQEAGHVNKITAFVTGAVTVLAGTVIFSGTWVGTLSDVFGAFAWGFFGQFGLDRISKLVQPTVNKALP